jgi:hypothetical protein
MSGFGKGYDDFLVRLHVVKFEGAIFEPFLGVRVAANVKLPRV